MLIENTKLYDFLKYMGRYVLPAVATFIVALFDIWGFAYGTEISATIMAIDTLLNVLLGISNENYSKQGGGDFFADYPGDPYDDDDEVKG